MAPTTFAYKAEHAQKRFHEATLHPTWNPAALGIRDSNAPAWFELLEAYQGRKDAQWLLRGVPKPEDPEQSHELAREIMVDGELTAKQKHEMLLVLGKIVAMGNQSGAWDVCPVPISTYVPREKGPYTPEAFSSVLADVRRLKQFFLSSFPQKLDLDQKAEAGRILCSAILYGGLLNTASLEALSRQLSEPLNVVRGKAYIDLNLSWRGHEDMEVRRWFPDILTEVLLLYYSGATIAKGVPGSPWECIKSYLSKAGCPNRLRPKRLSNLLHIVAMELSLTLPPVLLTYAKRGCISHSLKPHAWLRLQGLPPASSAETQVERPPDLTLDADNLEPPSPLEAADWMESLRHFLRVKTKPVARAALRRFRDTHSYKNGGHLAVYLTGWAEAMLSEGSMLGRPLQLSTVYQYITALGNRLTGIPGSGDFPRLGAEAIEEIYIQILESAQTRGLRQKLARILREFHHHLVTRHHVVEIDPDILGARDGLAPVDANIISHDEFDRILRLLDRSGLERIHPELIIIAKLVCILAFRCGMRRSEVQKLRLVDIQGTVDPETLVRPHATRRLKTHNSTRRVPLRELLKQDELRLLQDWRDKRLKEEKADPWSEYLFSIPSKGYAFISEELLFDVIHRAMRQATGDPSVRFHHFRHSCASWLTLAFFVADYGYPKEYFAHLPLTSRWLDNAKLFRQGWYRHDLPTRKHLYTVCSLLGHGGPDITLEHYIHWCDILLANALCDGEEPNYREALTEAAIHVCWLPSSTAYRLAKVGHQKLLKRLRKDTGDRCHTLATTAQGGGIHRPAESRSSELKEADICAKIERVRMALRMYSQFATPPEVLGEHYGLREQDVATYVERALYLANQHSRVGKKRFRHRMLKVQIDKRKPSDRKRLLCPIEPRRSWEIQDAEELLRNLERLASSDLASLRWALCYYAENAWASRNEVVVKNHDDAIRYFKFLKGIGIENAQIKLSHYVSPEIAENKLERRFNSWRKSFPTSMRDISVNAVSVRRRQIRGQGWLGIGTTSSARRAETKDASAGFRYAMIMSAIYFGYS